MSMSFARVLGDEIDDAEPRLARAVPRLVDSDDETTPHKAPPIGRWSPCCCTSLMLALILLVAIAMLTVHSMQDYKNFAAILFLPQLAASHAPTLPPTAAALPRVPPTSPQSPPLQPPDPSLPPDPAPPPVPSPPPSPSPLLPDVGCAWLASGINVHMLNPPAWCSVFSGQRIECEQAYTFKHRNALYHRCFYVMDSSSIHDETCQAEAEGYRCRPPIPHPPLHSPSMPPPSPSPSTPPSTPPLPPAAPSAPPPSVLNQGEECYISCGSKQGACDFCGPYGACCKQGDTTAPIQTDCLPNY